MELQYFKKTETTASNDEIITYYVTGGKQSTVLMMNRDEPVRYIISYLPGTIDVTDEMRKISQSEFLAAATRSNNAVCWYVDGVNGINGK
ncbi:hypothetical protein QQ054_23715 [Oscillatoria amoena NRMC-F 0135]|nr:hypothetical protein [Oscillatoria amoena NRMC-F 0135]